MLEFALLPSLYCICAQIDCFRQQSQVLRELALPLSSTNNLHLGNFQDKTRDKMSETVFLGGVIRRDQNNISAYA